MWMKTYTTNMGACHATKPSALLEDDMHREIR